MRAIGIILAGGNNNRMRELSNKRAIAAMPIAGSYRAIDFALSNMANSHIQKVAVLTQYNARSLNEHLSSSKWWDFGRKQGGLYVFTPTITRDNSLWYQGTADAIYQNLTFLKNSHEPYVVIASGDGIYKLDYNKVLEYHIAKRADVTVVCTTCQDQSQVERCGVLRMNEDCRIEEFEEKPIVSSYNTVSQPCFLLWLFTINFLVFTIMIIHTGPRVAEIWLMVFPKMTGSRICVKNRTMPRIMAIRLILQRIFFQLIPAFASISDCPWVHIRIICTLRKALA